MVTVVLSKSYWRWYFVSVHKFRVPRSGLVFCLKLAPMSKNKGYRSGIKGFSSDFMDVRSKKSRALKNKPKVLIYALWPYHGENVEIFVKPITFERWTLNPWTVTFNTPFYLLGTHKHILYRTLLMNFTYYNSLPGPTHVLRSISLLISNLIATLSNICAGCQILKSKKHQKGGFERGICPENTDLIRGKMCWFRL